MDKQRKLESFDMVTRQRNVVFGMLFLVTITAFLLAVRIFTSTEKVVLVPGLSREAWVTSEGVSESYLEEMTAMYLPMLLDLDTNSIEWKRDRLISYISETDPRYLKEFHEYFARVKEQYSGFGLSTHFALKKIESNQKKLSVIAHGVLVQHFGNRGNQTLNASYLITYDWKGGRLLLKEFKKLSKEDMNA